MATIELDLPLEDTPASRFMVWIMAGLTFLAVLAFAIATFSDASLRLSALEPRILTIALPGGGDRQTAALETDQVLNLLKGTPGIAYSALVAKEELDKLIEPWLGKTEPGQAMVLPRLIDVTYNPGVVPDIVRLDDRLKAIVPGASIGETGPSTVLTDRMAETLRLIGGGAGVAVLLATVVIVVVVTRLSLDLHDDTVDLLRLMGAPDAYVARQFEQYALASGLKGGMIGFAAGLATVLAFIYLPRAAQTAPILPINARPVDWVLLAAVPVVTAILVTFSAKVTAVRGLARLR